MIFASGKGPPAPGKRQPALGKGPTVPGEGLPVQGKGPPEPGKGPLPLAKDHLRLHGQSNER